MKDSIKETLIGLFESSHVPTEQQDSFIAIFESAVAAEAKVIAERVYDAVVADANEEKLQLESKLNEYSQYLIEEYANKLDTYLSYTTEQLFQENKLAITNGVKAQMFDSLVEGIKNVVHEHGISIADEQVDVVAGLEGNLSETKDALNAAKHEIIALREQIAKMKKESSFAEATKSLTQTQKERVSFLANELPFDETYDDKLSSLIEAVTYKSSVDNAPAPSTTANKRTSLKAICNL